MTATTIAVLQMTTGIDPDANTRTICEAVAEAGRGGAAMLFTPEMAVLLDQKRGRAAEHILPEDGHPAIAAIGAAAREAGVWVALGSMAVQGKGERWANRALVLDDQGQIAARYDKMHMFDVKLDSGEEWHESKAYAPGEEVVTVETPVGRLGLSICYDVRFPALYDALGRAKCDVIAIPAAFTRATGKDHWHLLQRARAVESSAFVVSAAQVGEHEDGRATYGHSLVVDPWGEVLLDMGADGPGLAFAQLDTGRLEKVRRQLPSLANRRDLPRFQDK